MQHFFHWHFHRPDITAEIWKLVKVRHNFCILCDIIKISLNCNKNLMNVIFAYGCKLQKYHINSIIIIAVLLTAVAPHHSLLFRDINLCLDGGSFGHWGWSGSAWSELWRSSILKCAIYECHRKWAYDGVTNFNQSSLPWMMVDKTKFDGKVSMGLLVGWVSIRPVAASYDISINGQHFNIHSGLKV